MEETPSEASSLSGGTGGGGGGGGGGSGEFLEDLDSITDLLPLPVDAVDSSVIKDVEARWARSHLIVALCRRYYY